MKSPALAPLAALIVAAGAACSESGNVTPSSSSSAGGPADAQASDGASSSSTSSGSSGQVSLEPERLVADKSTECVGSYVQDAPIPGENKAFQVAAQARSFVLLTPPATYKGPRPLFVGFHGTSENGQKFVTRAKLQEFADQGFIVLAPSAVGNGVVWPVWDGMRPPGQETSPENKDLAFFDKMVRCTAAHYEVDKKRIYVGGHSAGGIFTNKVLRARSELVAGGIVGSGVFSLTGNGGPPALPAGVFAIVTWGGDNDKYSGTTPNGVNVPEFSFVEQASLASEFYESDAKSGQVQCRGDNLGHAWLPMNAWFQKALLAHPKGATQAPGMPAVPANVPAACSETAYKVAPLPEITCSASSTAGCEAACQLMADCGAENRTVGTVLKPQLATFGFTASSCAGCITRCQSVGGSQANTAALACFKTAQAGAVCGPGIEGSLPLMDAINTCCKNRADSTFCVATCTELNKNEAAAPFFPVCKAIAP